ncbi:MAG: cadherin-like domain-containing protein, partial [Thermoplasmatales archaeon]
MNKYSNLKNVLIIFLLINALFTPSITIYQASGDINDINVENENSSNSTDSDNSTSSATITKNPKKIKIDQDIYSVEISPLSGGGAIWTTRDDCGTQEQNANEYCSGDDVFINGDGFPPNTDLNWSITGQPGSCDPNTIVANGTINSGESGSFCFEAYTINIDDCDGYKVNVENKIDNYNVVICNYAPIGNDDYATVDEGGTVTVLDSGNYSVLDNDSDADDDPLDADLISGPTHGSLSFNSDGTFSYTHDGGETISDSFVYNVSDPYGAYDYATVFITINPQNDPPVLNLIGNQQVDEGDTLTTPISATDPDGDTLTITATNLPDFGTLTDNGDG